jgi:hypothetical protein
MPRRFIQTRLAQQFLLTTDSDRLRRRVRRPVVSFHAVWVFGWRRIAASRMDVWVQTRVVQGGLFSFSLSFFVDAVGTIIADRPPHRTVRALRRIRLPLWMSGEEASRLCFSHTAQSLGHRFPALCRVGVGLNDVLLGPRPFLPRLRRRSLFFVRLVHRSIWRGPTPPERTCPPSGFAPSRTGLVPFRAEALQRSPGSRACCFSACAGSKTTQDRLLARDYRDKVVMPSSNQERVGVLDLRFSKLNNLAHRYPCLRFKRHLTMPPARLRAKMESLSPFLQDSFILYNMPV